MVKAAFVQGRLTEDELDARLALALASRTYAELAAVTADLPVGLIEAQLPSRPARARAPASPAIRSGLLISAATTLAVAAWLLAWLTGSAELFTLAISITVASFGSFLVAGSVMLESRHDRRSAGQPVPGS